MITAHIPNSIELTMLANKARYNLDNIYVCSNFVIESISKEELANH